jgi:autotransporter-associated beta strand protein
LVLDASNFALTDILYLDGSGASSLGALRVNSGTATLSYPLFVRNSAAIVTANSTTLVLVGNGILGWGANSDIVFRTEGESTIVLRDQIYSSISNITKTGAGRLVLGSAGNDFTGLLDIQQGTVVLDSGILGRSSGPTQVAAGATLALEAGRTVNDIIFIAGEGDNGYHGYQGAIHAVSGANIVNGAIILNDAATIYVDSNATLRLNGTISSLGSRVLTIGTRGGAAGADYGVATLAGNLDSSLWLLEKEGSGIAYVAGSNSHGNTRIYDGVLVAQNDNALGGYAIVWPYGSLVLEAANVHSDLSLTASGFGVHAAYGSAVLRSLTFTNGSGQDGSVTIDGVTSIGKIGSGEAYLRGNIGTRSHSFVVPNLDFHVDGGTLNVSGSIDSSIGAIAKYGNGTVLAISGNIYTTSNLNVNEGTVALSGTVANLAVTVASGATLEVNASNVFFGSASSGLTVVDVASGGSLVLGANGTSVTDTILTLTGSGNVSLLNGSTLNVLSGNYSGVVQSSGSLVKDGAANSTLLLTGASTYLGGTTVQGGTLNLANVGSLTSNVVVANGGVFVANGLVLADIPDEIAGNVFVNAGGLLKGSGTIAGDVTNSGVVAPGNSPGILTVNGTYVESGTLQVEIGGTAGAGVNPNGHDQIHVTGGGYTISAGVAMLQLTKYNDFESTRRDSFLAVNVDGPNAIVGTYHTLDRSSFSSQLFFDHSNGKVYGSGLTEAQTFAEYGLTNANRRAVGYALYQDGLITAATIKNGALSAAAAKAFVNGSTDLGAAVETLLLSIDPAAILDALSPEAYAGLGDAASRISRGHFRALGSALAGANQTWDFAVGYTDQRFRTGSSSTSLDQLMTDSSTHLSANKSFGTDCGLAVLLSDERGHISSSNLDGKMTTGPTNGTSSWASCTPMARRMSSATVPSPTTSPPVPTASSSRSRPRPRLTPRPPMC